jgi:glutathione peroxidase
MPVLLIAQSDVEEGFAVGYDGRMFKPYGAASLGFVFTAALTAVSAAGAPGGTVASFYDLKTTYLDGKPADLGVFRGKVTLVVNVASKCGFTPQYEGLEKLNKELSGKGFAVLGFPSNDFGQQEPGTAQEIAQFCKLTYGVTFPMFGKVVTKAGPDQSPVYKLLGSTGHLPAWNFSKYVVGKDGQILAFFPSEVTPESAELRGAIMKALGAR